ncbi:MAG TPA: phenylalanine--tRNA ligase subunit alpha, partial [Segetibacter sp.]
MEELLQKIEACKLEISAFAAKTPDEVEAFRIKFLGSKGMVKSIMGEMKNVPGENRKEFGLILNAFKVFAEEKFETLQNSLTTQEQHN